MAFECHHSPWYPKWKVNTALLRVINYTDGDSLLARSAACEPHCALRTLCHLEGDETTVLLNSRFPTLISLPEINCTVTTPAHNLGQFTFNASNCALQIDSNGENPVFSWALFAICLFVLIVPYEFDQWRKRQTNYQTDFDRYCFGNVPRVPSSRRLVSISLFRGLSVLMMAFVNSGGGGHTIFLHSPWNGFTIADLVFPMFIFCMGLSSQWSISYKTTADVRWTVFCRRVILLILFGIFIVNGGNDWLTIRVNGVLQRIALCQAVLYFFQTRYNMKQNDYYYFSIEHRYPDPRVGSEDYDLIDEYDTIAGEHNELINRETHPARSVRWYTHYLGEWQIFYKLFIVAYLLVIANALLVLIPVPGCPFMYLGAGGWTDDGQHSDCTGGIYGWLDRFLIRDHVYPKPECKEDFNCAKIDPESFFTTFFALINVFGGAHAVQIIRYFPNRRQQNVRLFIYGLLHVGFACGSYFLFPINKQLWTPTFAFLTTGICYWIFLFFRYFFDSCFGLFRLRHMAYVGDNALLIYLLQELFADRCPYTFNVGSSLLANTALSFWTVICSLILGWFLHKHDITLTL